MQQMVGRDWRYSCCHLPVLAKVGGGSGGGGDGGEELLGFLFYFERCYVYNIFTTNHTWLIVISSILNLTLRLLFCPNNNNL